MLQLFTRTAVTSPPGTCVTETIHVMPGCAEGGRIQARSMFATICACQRAACVAVAQRVATLLGFEAAAQFRLARQPRLLVRGLLGRRGLVGLLLSRSGLLVGGGLLGCRLGGSLLFRLERARLPSSRLPAPAPAPAASSLPRAFPVRAFPAPGVPPPACARSRPDRAWAVPAPPAPARVPARVRVGGGSGLGAGAMFFERRARRPRWPRWPASRPAAADASS